MSGPVRVASRDRVSRGLCPKCGKEAAPYYLCYDCRTLGRLERSLKRGVNCGSLRVLGKGKHALWSLRPGATEENGRRWEKWQTPFILPETDRRSAPRLRGIRVDVEATLIEVIRFIGRPCTTQEIVEAWGRLRAKRDAPLAHDLGRIIAAADKRARRAEKLAAVHERRGRLHG